jgi:hypothetical protein
MKKCRIIKRIDPCGEITYVIQQKHFLLRWMWVDAWVNQLFPFALNDTFNSLEEAKRNLCHFDGTKIIEHVIKEY